MRPFSIRHAFLVASMLSLACGCSASSGDEPQDGGATDARTSDHDDGGAPPHHDDGGAPHDGGSSTPDATNDGSVLHDGDPDSTVPPADAASDASHATDAPTDVLSDAGLTDALTDSGLVDVITDGALTDAIADSATDAPMDGDDASDATTDPPDANPCVDLGHPTYCADVNGGYACVALEHDEANCGACGRSCGGTACINGHCDSRTVAPLQHAPGDVKIRGDRLYWLDGAGDGYANGPSAVMTAPIAGGVVTQLGSGPVGGDQLAVDATNAYWTTCAQNLPGSVMKVPLAGGSPTTIAGNLGCGIGIAVDANNVYWADSRKNTVSKAALDTGAITTIATQQNAPKGIAVDATNVYWANALGKIMKQPLAGGPSVQIGSAIGVLSDRILVDGQNVPWSSFSGIIGATPIDGSATVTIASGLTDASLRALDSGRLYFCTDIRGSQIAQASYVMFLDLTTGAPTSIAGEGSPTANAIIGGIAVDATTVYWSYDPLGSTGAIHAIMKP